jgi:erythromycin esterase-like protein
MAAGDAELREAIRQVAQPLKGAAGDYDELMQFIGEARFVLLGEASHGTHEFYRARAEITKRLIKEKGFTAVAVEADWPDAYRVNCYIRGADRDKTALEALGDFERFPTWMWRNADVLDFVGWLRDYNLNLRQDRNKIGFYGLDLYSLHRSMQAVIKYLEKVDPEAARQARSRYACFDHASEDPQAYGYAVTFGVSQPCQQEAINQLVELQRNAHQYIQRDGGMAEDEQFYAEQNARLAKNSEEYYRTMFTGRVSSWNLRDCHMAETLDQLADHLSRQGQPAKIVVWEHNSHLGDARATELGRSGELNVGQVVRQHYDDQARLIGFSTYMGTVTAANNWDEPAELKRVRPGLPGSYEALFHDVSLPAFFLNLRENNPAVEGLRQERLERAIGVIYRPETERISHYFEASLPQQFDGLIYFDETRAVEPLERAPHWHTVDETPQATLD